MSSNELGFVKRIERIQVRGRTVAASRLLLPVGPLKIWNEQLRVNRLSYIRVY